MRRRPGAGIPRLGVGAVLLVLLATIVAGLGQLAPVPARAATTGVSVAIDAISPRVPTPGQRLRVTGTVTNHGSTPIAELSVRLRLSVIPISSRSELQAMSSGAMPEDGVPVTGSLVHPRPTLAAGASVGFVLDVPLSSLGLGPFGVYPMGVEVRGSTPAGYGRVAIVQTFLPWMPTGAAPSPTGVAWLWPLASPPRLDVAGQFLGDQLGASLQPQGRLGTLLAIGAASPVPLTWVVDPALLQSAQTMAGGYQAIEGSQTLRAGPNGPQAAAWLGGLRAAVTRSTVLALPYSDADVTALVRAGLGADVAPALELGRTVAGQVLGAPVGTDVTWPAGGYADPQTLSTLRADGVTTVVLRSSAYPPTTAVTYTPTGRGSLSTSSGTMAALLSDDTLDTVVDTATPTRTDRVLGEQLFLAQTALITAERPAQARTVLIAPSRLWDPSPSYARALLDITASVPWLRPATLAQLQALPPANVARAAFTFPASAVAAELPVAYLRQVVQAQASANRTASLLTSPQPMRAAWLAAVLRMASADLRTQPQLRTALLYAARTRAIALSHAVRVVSTTVTLGSRSGTFPLTITNDLSQQVTVDIGLTPTSARIGVTAPPSVTIEPHRKAQVLVRAQALANGLALVDAQLRTSTGAPYGPVVPIRVNVTQYATIGTLVVGLAAVVLFAASGVRLARRARAARRTGAR